MKRATLFVTVAAFLRVVCQAADKPNVVVIVSDDAGYRTIALGKWHLG